MGIAAWPALPDGSVPVWGSAGFEVDGRALPFLAYGTSEAGWDESLGDLHAEVAAGEHPIDVTSRHLACLAFERWATGPVETVLEIGSADGRFLQTLAARRPGIRLIGSDTAPGSLLRIHGRAPEIPLLQMDLVHCPLPDGSVDAVVALNVLEHIEDDRCALDRMARLLRPEGIAVIEVPAGPGLFDAYDAQLKHFRRYGAGELGRKLRGAGLEVLALTHVGCFVFPGFALVKKLRRWRGRKPDAAVVSESIRSSASWPIDRLFRLERRLAFRAAWPFGIRCFAVARQPAR